MREINQSSESDTNDGGESSDGEEDPEIERPIISSKVVTSSLENIKIWLMAQDQEDSTIFNSIHNIESFMSKCRLNNMRQSIIGDYFTAQNANTSN